MPPNGILGSECVIPLTNTLPVSSLAATYSAVESLLVHTAALKLGGGIDGYVR